MIEVILIDMTILFIFNFFIFNLLTSRYKTLLSLDTIHTHAYAKKIYFASFNKKSWHYLVFLN